MPIDPTKRLAQLEQENAIFRARLKVLETQRNDALNDGMIKEAAAKMEREAIIRGTTAQVEELKAQLAKVQKALSDATAAKPAEAPSAVDPPAPNGHANGEACPAA